ncbi:MAG TPA: YlbF family regulator [Clostridia bacterium]|jgi:cell fate (sporulation/competence/biofilm development) regulator YlbF (YheA/YmcA/DUF963 family)|nr:YlbF family regulator [Clostridia bacterium]
MSILEKAMELAEDIANSPELAEVREAEIKMYQNPAAVEGLKKISEKQEELKDYQMLGKEIPKEQLEEFYKIQEEVQQIEEIQNYLQAQSRFNQLIQTINLIIERAVTGDRDGGCSGNCSSGCSGCC